MRAGFFIEIRRVQAAGKRVPGRSPETSPDLRYVLAGRYLAGALGQRIGRRSCAREKCGGAARGHGGSPQRRYRSGERIRRASADPRRAVQPPPPEPVSEPTATTARRILVVDDNRDAALSLAMLLALTGDETHTAHDGLEAVEAAARLKPDVILLDIGLPKMNGYEVAARYAESRGARPLCWWR